ncbi:MAG: GNAT family N-acetyltransferase [Rickettsiales bacterium]|jgi:ribosomal-protein-alanine N-acetyltransferase|nr:GNAT family N-acetyltransferase [Rickettsiales bacterium]
MNIFETDKYVVKTFTMDNFDEFCEINQDPVVAKYVNHNDGKPKTLRECINKYSDITYSQDKDGYSYWAIHEKNDTFIGQCGGLKSWFGDVNFCYAFRKKYWGKGIGTEVCRIVSNYLFDNFEDITKLTCSAFSENVASVKLLKKLGFECLRTEKEFGKELEFFELKREDYEKKKNI